MESCSAPSASGSWGKGAMAVAVVGWAFFGIGEDLVGLANFLEFFLGFFISLMFVGMMLDGEFSISLFNFLGGNGAANAEHFVVIFFGGHGLGGGDRRGSHRNNATGSEKTIADFVATTALVKDKTFGFSRRGFLAEGFVPVRVEGFAEGFNGGDTVIGEESIELALNQFHTSDNGCGVGGGSGGLEAELEVIEEGEEVTEDGLVSVAKGFLFFASEAFADIIEFRAGT
jgi:hypothetical protein